MSVQQVTMIAALVLLGVATPMLLRRRRVAPLWMMLAALVLGIVTAVVARRSPLQELTPEVLVAARERWSAQAIDGYEIEVLVQSDRLEDGRFEIQVQNGDVVQASQNGLPTNAGEAYAVRGLFDILARELELAKHPSAGLGAPPGYRAYLRVRFNAGQSYPERYRRTVGGTSNGVEITVLRFAPTTVVGH